MKNCFFVLFICVCFQASAYSEGLKTFSDTNNIPIARVNNHDNIRRELIKCDKLDGREDGILRVGSNENINNQVTDALFRKPNELRYWIEKNDVLITTNNDKIRYLRYVANVLTAFRIKALKRIISPTELPALLSSAEKIMKAMAEGQSILPFIKASSYQVAKINTDIFAEGAARYPANAILYQKYARFNPDKILKTIGPFSSEPYADSLIAVAARLNPVQFYSYAQSENSTVGKLIHRNTDKMVSQVATLSRTENALLYFPFLDDLLSGRQTIDSIKKLVGDGDKTYDSVGYYKLLVKTAIAYSRRMAAPLKDTPTAYLGANGLSNTLHTKAKAHFITPINNLHDESNLAIRMKAIQPLNATDLYFMLVMGENDIYTSSYKHSFNRMLQLMGSKPRTDSLLLSVNFDHFRKFIKMAANYNKLDTFLKLMPPLRSELVMRGFVANLDYNNLEDAVDVADAYSSITDKNLLQSMMENVMQNENRAIAQNNKSSRIIYGLLKTIFLSADEKNNIDVAAQTGIPPIYDVANKYMQDEKGNIVEQVFFYGDKDGKLFYPSFRNSFSDKDWKVTEKKEWMEAVSVKGNVMVFANKPLDNDANLDDSAQVHLGAYLEEQNLKPSVVVHRGHSYWLERTMSRMPGDAKIVLLGSCGGYQNLSKILEINPDAHIISTKEIGTGDINRPILTYMNDVFADGSDLNWRKMWAGLTKTFSADQSKAVRDSWDDYVPPYKNLGAIFLKAYTKKMEAE